MASIYESRNGRWTAQVNAAGTRSSKTFNSKTEAVRWARQTEAAVDRGKTPARHDLKFGDIMDAYLDHISGLSPSKSKLSALGIIREHLARKPLRDMTRAAVFREFVKERGKGGTGPATIGMDLTYIGTVLKQGGALLDIDTSAERGSLASVRALLNASGAVSRPAERSRRPTDAELLKLKAFWGKRRRGTDIWAVTAFAITTAMRLAEICRITWADLDEEKRTVVIRDRKHPRSKKGNDEEVPLLRGHVTIGGEALDPMEIIRQTPRNGEAIFGYDPKTISTMFTRAVASCEIDDLHLHDLRHDGVSRLFAAGYSIEQVSLVSGHKDWNMLRRYTQLRAEDLHRD
jgi:integrase